MFQASRQSVEDLVDDVKYLWCPTAVPVLDEPPSSLEFLRDYVSLSRPCIIRNAVLDGSQRSCLHVGLDDLIASTPDLELVVDASPDGNADVLRRVTSTDPLPQGGDSVGCTKEMFLQPEERRMTLSELGKELRKRKKPPINPFPMDRIFSLEKGKVPQDHVGNDSDKDEETVYYYSRQNDCLRTELEILWGKSSFPSSFPFAEESFGTGPPQAVNLWIGNEEAISSMHKDHYENLFYVASGEKVFTLCPPADALFLYEKEFESGRFQSGQRERGSWSAQQDFDADGSPTKVKWIAADVTRKYDPQYTNRFPLLEFTHPIEVTVQAGCMLYLPSLWFHRVTQSCETVGINYWYDMKFESPIWSSFHFLQQLEPISS